MSQDSAQSHRLDALRHAVSKAGGARGAAETLVSGLAELAPGHRASVLLLDRLDDRAVVLATAGPASDAARAEATIPLRVMPIPEPLLHGHVFYVDDLSAEHRSPLTKALAGAGIRAYAAVPVFSNGRLVATINLGSTLSAPVNEDAVAAARAVAPALGPHMEERLAGGRGRRAEMQYRGFFEGTPVGLYRMRPDGRILEANPAMASLLGYEEPADLRDTRFAELWIDDEDARESTTLLARVGTIRGFEARMRRRDGTPVWVRNSARAVRGDMGDLRHYEGSIEDVSQQREAGERLKASEERFRALVRHSTDLILTTDDRGSVRYIGPSVEETLGWTPDELVGVNIFRLIHHDDRRRALVELRRLATPGETRAATEVRVRTREGVYRYFDGRATNLLNDPAVEGIVVNARDVTERRLTEEKLAQDALHDELTGLPNRAFFRERLQHAFDISRRRSHYRFAVLYLDFDRFKVINDSLGHNVGDELLVVAGERLTTCIRQVDTLARLGGDEFAVLLDGINGISDATRIANRIHHALAQPLVLDDHEISITASIGIAPGEHFYETPEDVLRDADIAMYQAKERGPGTHVVFDAQMHEDAVAQLRLESDLARAVEANEFEVMYQPIVALRDGRLTGFEALVRWRHPDRGLLPPSAFFKTAEETGLIVVIGRWVLEEASHQVMRWQQEFPEHNDLSVSVNLSSRQFHHPDLLRDIERIIASSGLEPGSLHLEVTESVIVEDPEAATDTFLHLQGMGVHVDIDNFGTGYSSLSVLSHFPVDILKTDRSFVGRMDVDESDREIVRAVFSLAETLGLKVVAEGVETADQLAALRAMGCQLAQGFFFGRPIGPDGARLLLEGQPSTRA